MIPYPVLLCDIGETFSRFGAVRAPGEPVEILRRLRTNDFIDLAAAARCAIQDACFDEDMLEPSSLLACVAAPVSGRKCNVSGSRWRVDGCAVASSLGLEHGLLLNNFEVLALSLPANETDWRIPIGALSRNLAMETSARRGPGNQEKPSRDASNFGSTVQLVLAPANILGCAALISTGRRYVAFPSEAASVTIFPVGEEQKQIWKVLGHVRVPNGCNPVPAGTILCNRGLARLHRARLSVHGISAAEPDPARIVQLGVMDARSEAAKTIRLFWTILARFAGDMAITFAARGGVNLAGDFLKTILPLLDPRDFRQAFQAGRPALSNMQSIPIHMISREDALLHGLAAIAANPSQYAIDYANREWL